MDQGTRKLSVILFSDIVGYSAQSHRNEPLAMQLLEEHRTLLRALFAEFSGREVKTIGDAFLVDFSTALEAVRCAVEIQRRLHSRNEQSPRERRIQVRIGIHLGEILQKGEDLYGDEVNIAARLVHLSPAGGICISQHVYDQIHNQVGVRFAPMGRRKLKNIPEPMPLYRLSPAFAARGYHRIFSGIADRLRGLTQQVSRPVAILALLTLVLAISLQLANRRAGKAKQANDGSDKSRIAILPFSSISLSGQDEYLSEGMTDELISSLSQVKGLRVLARSTVLPYRGTQRPPSEIGAELGVGSLIEGRVRKTGDAIRITAQLIDVDTGAYAWSQDFDGQIDKLFDIQKTIAKNVTAKFDPRVIASLPQSMERDREPTPEAYVLYLKGKYFFNKRTHDGFRRAIEFYQMAAAQDPKMARAWSALANTYNLLTWYGLYEPNKADSIARGYIGKALHLDPDSDEAHLAAAEHSLNFDRQWEDAEKSYQRAIRLNPNSALAQQWYADLLMSQGRFDEASARLHTALDLEPLGLPANVAYGRWFYYTGAYDEAVRRYRLVIEMDPTFAIAHYWLGLALIKKGMYKEAMESLEKASRLGEEAPSIVAAKALALGLTGRAVEARQRLNELTQSRKSRYVSAYEMAYAHLGVGDKPQAIRLLQSAKAEHSAQLRLVAVDPLFASLHDAPEFKALVQDLRLAIPAKQ